MPATLVQVNVSGGGMPKRPVAAARVTAAGVAGDRQANRTYHGGPDRAVCLYSVELYAWLNGQGAAVGPGDVGENFTAGGVDLQALSVGDRLRIGGGGDGSGHDDAGGSGCVVELTGVRDPCRQLNRRHPGLLELIAGRSGWVARVVREGEVRPGDAIAVEPRPG